MESRNQKIPQASPLDIDGSNESSAVAVCKIRTTFCSSSWMNCRPTQPVVLKPTISHLWSQKSRPQTWKPPHACREGWSGALIDQVCHLRRSLRRNSMYENRVAQIRSLSLHVEKP